MPRSRARLAVPVALALTAVAAVGCGGEEEVRDFGSNPVEIALSEYRIEPAKVRVRARRGGEATTFIVRVVGRLTHNLTVEVPRERGENRPEEGQGAEVVGRTPTGHGGEEVRDAFRLEPGTYRLRCSIANHDDLGMEGELEVVEGDG